jgi:hypothetical protein
MTATLERPTTEEPAATIPTPAPDAGEVASATPTPEPEPEGEPARVAGISNAAPEQVKIMGYEVSYNVTGVQINRDALQDRMARAGIADFFPKKPPTEKEALRRAMAAWAKTLGSTAFDTDSERDDIVRQKKLIREAKSTGDEDGTARPIVMALVDEATLGMAASLKHVVSYRAKLTPPQKVGETTTGWTLTVSTEARGKISEAEREEREEERQRVDRQIRALWEIHRNLYTGKDISELLIAIIHDAWGYSVESGTGVWFLPARAADLVERLRDFVRGLPVRDGGKAPHFRIRENFDWPNTVEALREAAQDQIMAEIRDFENSLKATTKRLDENPGSVKPTTMKEMVGQLMAVRAKATFFADITGMRQERMDAELVRLGGQAVKIAKRAATERGERESRLVATVAPPPAPVASEAREEREVRTS